MTPAEMVADVRETANIAGSLGAASDSEIVKYLNQAKDLLASRIIQADQKHFEVDDAVDFVANQEQYDIPTRFKDGKISLVERLNSDGTVKRVVERRRFQDKESWSQVLSNAADAGQIYYIRDRKIGFKPVPAQAQTSAIRVYGIQHPVDFFWATLDSGVSDPTTTTFVLPASGSLLKGGRPHTETDYYKNALVRVIGGAGRGVERKITAYNAATRTCTIESAWTVNDVKDQQYVIFGKIPEEHHQGLVIYAAMCIARKRQDKALYPTLKKEWDEWVRNADDAIDPRSYDRNLHIEVPPDYLYD